MSAPASDLPLAASAPWHHSELPASSPMWPRKAPGLHKALVYSGAQRALGARRPQGRPRPAPAGDARVAGEARWRL